MKIRLAAYLQPDSIVDGETENFVIRLTDGLYKTRKNWFGKKGDSMVKTANLMHEYDELITDTPQGLIDLLFNDGTMDDFLSFETLFNAFMSDKFKFPENRERILVGFVMSLDGQGIDIPTEIPQEYVDQAREKERLASEREAYDKANKIKRKIKHIETFESFAVRDEEDMINEGVVVKKARGGMKVVKEDGTESVLPSITKVLSAMDDKDWYEKWVAKVGKETAVAISKTLFASKEWAKSANVKEVQQQVINTINSVEGLEVEYYEIVDKNTLQPTDNWDNAVGCVTVYCGPVRLIDNIRY